MTAGIASMRLLAMSLDMPKVFGHPNRMPFTGILTRVGVPSDTAPHGSGGKRVLIKYEAAERAIPSLMGMGVGLTADLDGHDASKKIGIITGAHIEGDALRIEGFIYAADFPKESVRIHLEQDSLGFSFEARPLHVEEIDADPWVIDDCVFTGAAILMKNKAAYLTTSLAAAAAQAQEARTVDNDMKAALAETIAAAMAPVTEAIGKVSERISAVEGSMTAINQRVEANAAIVTKVEPLAAKLEAAAAAMEAAGVGTDAAAGHVARLRQMAGHMRSEALQGRLPAAYSAPDAAQPIQIAAAAPKVEESAAFLALTAKLEAAATKAEADKKASDDQVASLNTKLADMQAAADKLKNAPERKTHPPAITALLAKNGMTPDGEEGRISQAQLEKMVEGKPLTQRIELKLAAQKAGIIG